MNVVLFAWCPTASLYLDALVESGVVPLRVVTGPGAPAEAALSRPGIPLERHARLDDRGFAARLARMRLDLVLVAGWPEKLGDGVCRAARLGAVNCHPSLLPRYRGRHPLFWAILEGEREVGITLHRMTSEIDAGPILLQRALPVPPDATSASLAGAADRAGAELVTELLSAAHSGALPSGRDQDSGAATHFPPVLPEHGLLDWTAKSARLERLVRACRGVTLAHSFYQGMKLGVLAAHPEPGSGTPGTVLAVDASGMLVATADAALRIERFLFVDREHDAATLGDQLGITPGARLTHNPAL